MTTPVSAIDRVEFTVDVGKIGEFVRATAVADPVHVDDAAASSAGFEARPATATHVVVAGHHRDQQALVTRLGLDLARVVVGSVRWTYARPLVAGDRLAGERRVVGDETRAGRDGISMRLITLETEYVEPAGAPVIWVREVIIERGNRT
jgi:acyl dehydratase